MRGKDLTSRKDGGYLLNCQLSRHVQNANESVRQQVERYRASAAWLDRNLHLDMHREGGAYTCDESCGELTRDGAERCDVAQKHYGQQIAEAKPRISIIRLMILIPHCINEIEGGGRWNAGQVWRSVG